MAPPRTSSESVTESIRIPHSVSLKVLRLSPPALSRQHPLPPPSTSNQFNIDPAAALAYPLSRADSQFTLSPITTLPSSFGTVYVGGAFECTLCINNELPVSKTTGLSVSHVRVDADVQTPSTPHSVSLPLSAASSVDPDATSSLAPGETLQRILRCPLREEGNHVIAITVTYTETQATVSEESGSLQPPAGERVRTFRKLYQFVAEPLMGVRTKIRAVRSVTTTGKGTSTYALEAQLENLSDGPVTLEVAETVTREGVESRSLNAWESTSADVPYSRKPLMAPGDILQAAFLLSEGNVEQKGEVAEKKSLGDGLCQLTVRWRGEMGEPGSVTTTWLSTKKR